ncbi:MAG TPA: hypothetical protein VLB69_12660, partial [Rudaea sp.]|nr:hypothetical protein [Rudaea sp.]
TAISIDANAARKWLYLDTTSNGAASVQYFSYTTPVGAPPSSQLGRVAFTDMHDYVGDTSGINVAFPSGGCTTSSLTPQEKALVYATFDLQRCVGSTLE